MIKTGKITVDGGDVVRSHLILKVSLSGMNMVMWRAKVFIFLFRMIEPIWPAAIVLDMSDGE